MIEFLLTQHILRCIFSTLTRSFSGLVLHVYRYHVSMVNQVLVTFWNVTGDKVIFYSGNIWPLSPASLLDFALFAQKEGFPAAVQDTRY